METPVPVKEVRFYGERVRALHRARGLSAARLAEEIGISVRHIYRIENNQRPHIWAITIGRVAQALGTSCDYLMGLSDVPQKASRRETPIQNVQLHGERGRALRHVRGLSAERLARKSDVSLRHLYKIENNVRPKVWGITIARIAQALGTSLDYLMGLSDVPDEVDHDDAHPHC